MAADRSGAIFESRERKLRKCEHIVSFEPNAYANINNLFRNEPITH